MGFGATLYEAGWNLLVARRLPRASDLLFRQNRRARWIDHYRNNILIEPNHKRPGLSLSLAPWNKLCIMTMHISLRSIWTMQKEHNLSACGVPLRLP